MVKVYFFSNIIMLNCTKVTINNPAIGYHTLILLEGLRKTYWDIGKKIADTQALTRPTVSEKCERIRNLNNYRSQIKAEYDLWAARVREWIAQFPDQYVLYGDVITSYYLDINMDSSQYGYYTLQDIIDEVLCEEDDHNKKSNQFQAKVRNIELKLAQ